MFEKIGEVIKPLVAKKSEVSKEAPHKVSEDTAKHKKDGNPKNPSQPEEGDVTILSVQVIRAFLKNEKEPDWKTIALLDLLERKGVLHIPVPNGTGICEAVRRAAGG